MMKARLAAMLFAALSTDPLPSTPVQEPTPAVVVEAPRPRPFAGIPVILPIRGQINSGYGLRYDPFTKHTSLHSGLDLQGRKGQPVFATADGTVTTVRRMGDYGNLVIVEHEDGVETYYGHLSAFAVHEGDQVKRGTKLGEVGSTGRATGPHLHYEIRRDGVIQNPTQFVLDAVTDEITKEE